MAAQPVSLNLDEAVKDRLQKLADKRHRSPDVMVREAVEQYVDREERREQFRQDALAAWADYEATGLHATEAEADTWLARLEAGEDAEPPACHE